MSSRRLSCSVRSLSLMVSAAWTRARSSRSSRATTWNFVRVADVTRPLRRAASTSWTAREITDMTSSGSRRRRRSRGALRRALVWGWPRRAKNFLLREDGGTAAVGQQVLRSRRWASRGRTACTGRCGHRSTVSRHLSQRPGVATSSVQRRSSHCDRTGWRPVWALPAQPCAPPAGGEIADVACLPRRRWTVGRSWWWATPVPSCSPHRLHHDRARRGQPGRRRLRGCGRSHPAGAISCRSGLTLQCQGALERGRGPLDTVIVSGGLRRGRCPARGARRAGARPGVRPRGHDREVPARRAGRGRTRRASPGQRAAPHPAVPRRARADAARRPPGPPRPRRVARHHHAV